MVGSLGERQPLRAQDALHGKANGRVLVLAGEGLGRAVPGSRGRADRERRRAPPRHERRAGRDREPRRQGGRDRAPAAHPPEREVRGRADRGGRRHLDAAGVARAQGRARVGAAGLVHGPDQASGAGPLPDRLARALPRRRRARARARPARARHLAARAHVAGAGLPVRDDGARPVDGARGQVPVRHGRDRPRRARHRRALPARRIPEVRARHRHDVPGPGEADLAPPAHGLRAVVRGDPEAGPRRHVPAALAGAERRRPLVRERDVPQPRDRRRPRFARGPDGRRRTTWAGACRASRSPGATDGRARRAGRPRHGRRPWNREGDRRAARRGRCLRSS